MSQEQSPLKIFRSWLYSDSEIKTRWQKAKQETEPESALEGLRWVHQNLRKHPSVFSHLYPSFLNDFFSPRLTSRLTESDLHDVETMGDALVGHEKVECSPAVVWFYLVQEYSLRGKTARALTLLMRIYNEPSTSEEEKQKVALELARLKAAGNEHVAVYLYCLQHSPKPGFIAELLGLLAKLWDADFDSSQERLLESRAMASRLLQVGAEAPWLYTALGLYALRVEHLPASAIPYFERAASIDSNNGLAWIGLLVSHSQQGTCQEVIALSDRLTQTTDQSAIAVRKLCLALHWLDTPASGGKPPTAQDLQNGNLDRYAREVTRITIARLLLIEGDAKQAAQILRTIPQTTPAHYRWSYYRAWADVLCGDSQDAAECFKVVKDLPAGWTVGCLLLENDPAALKESEVQSLLHRTPSAYTSVVKARVAISRSTSFDPLMLPVRRGGGLEEEMEVLRTALGVAFYQENVAEMAHMMIMPLFSRLPMADRLIWNALYSLLRGDKEQANTLLEKAARHYHYPRAALLLATYLLEQNPARIHDVDDLLAIAAAGRTHVKVELLRSYKQWHEGVREGIEEQERPPLPGDPRMRYQQGKLYLHFADQAYRRGEHDRGTSYYQHAAALLSFALEGSSSLPSNSRVLARCAAFIADPEQKATASLDLWNEVEQLAATDQHSWFLWNALLAQIWSGEPSHAAAACEELCVLLERVHELDDAVAVALARSIAYVCSCTERVGQAEKMVDVLRCLLSRSNNPSVRHFYRLCTTMAARSQYIQAPTDVRDQIYRSIEQQATADRGNGSLALLLASINLTGHQQDTAADSLRVTRPEDELESLLCNSVAMLLASDTPLPELPLPTESESSPLMQLYCLLAAVTAQTPEKGIEAMASALSGPLAVIAPIIDIRRCFDFLCASLLATREADARVITLTQHVAQYLQDGAPIITMARCLVAIGKVDLACRLWEQILEKMDGIDNAHLQEFVASLCHAAVQAYNANDALKMGQLLRQVVSLLNRRGQDKPDIGRIRGISAQELEQLAHQAELQVAACRLVTSCIAGGVPAHYLPGRYHFLEQIVDRWSSLFEALLNNDAALAQKNWQAAIKSSSLASDIRFQHGLTIVFYETIRENAMEHQAGSHTWAPATAR